MILIRSFIAALAFLIGVLPAWAQSSSPAVTTNHSVVITTGNTFQTVLAAATRRSLTIQNNNANDNCWIQYGVGVTAANASKGASIFLQPGWSYTRYFPFVPNDEIEATCATTSDTLYVDTQ